MTRRDDERKILKLAIIAAVLMIVMFMIGSAKAQTVVTGAGPSTSSQVITLFSGCSGVQYLGADGACHAAGGGFTAPSGWTVPATTAISWTSGTPQLDNTVTATVCSTGIGCTLGTASLLSGTANITSAPGHDIKTDTYATNITGRGNVGDTWSDFYHSFIANLNNAADTLGHALGTVLRATGTSTAGSNIQLLASLYGDMSMTNLNGATGVVTVGTLGWGVLSGTGTINEMDTLVLGPPPAITGSPTVNTLALLNVGDISPATVPGTSKSSVAVGGPLTKKAMLTVTASAPANLDNMAIFASGKEVQMAGGLVVSSDVGNLFGSPSAGTKFQMVNNGTNVFASWNDATAGWEMGELVASHSFVLQTNNGGANIFTATSSLMTMGQTLKITQLNASNLLFNNTAPTIAGAGCGGSSASIPNNNGTLAFTINVGTAPTSGGCTVTLPTAANGWYCDATDFTTNSTSIFQLKQTGGSTTSAVIQNFSDVAVATAPTANDIWRVSCKAY